MRLFMSIHIHKNVHVVLQDCKKKKLFSVGFVQCGQIGIILFFVHFVEFANSEVTKKYSDGIFSEGGLNFGVIF
jgi:hypothetical protein